MKQLLSNNYCSAIVFHFRTHLRNISLTGLLNQYSYIRLALSVLVFTFLFSSCNKFNFGGVKHCSQYKYSKERKVWVDSFGKAASCTIVDNNRIFAYYPEKGCNYLKDVFHSDDTIKFSEVPIRVGSGEGSVVQTYCIKQVYVNLDHSGKVLLIDEGIFCLTEHSEVKDEYAFTSCEGVKKKATSQKASNDQDKKKTQ